MKILLIKPNNRSDHIQPSLGLGYLATACRDKNDVAIIDCIKDDLNADRLLKIISASKPDLVGFQCYTFDLRFVKEALQRCKDFRKDILTIVGGPHPSSLPMESFEHFGNDLDFIFVGEAELGLPMLLDKIDGRATYDFSDIPGLAWRDNEKIHINNQIFVEDLDSFGMPAWDLIRPSEYPESQHGAFFKNFPISPIMITRGCPHLCTFCAGNIVSGRKIRRHSINFVLKQIRYLYEIHKIKEFHIVDDNFSFDKSYTKDFLRGLIDLRLDISWATPNGVRMDTLDEEMLKLMKKSGLYLISLGIESGSDRILGLMKKNITVKKIREYIDMIHKFGIEIAGFFIIGFPGERKEEIMKTIDFSLELDLIRANYFTYLPFPGTGSYSELIKNMEINSVDWDRFYFTSAPYAPKGLTRKKLKSLQRLAFFRFYSRPKIVIKNLCDIKSFNHFKFILKRFLHWICVA